MAAPGVDGILIHDHYYLLFLPNCISCNSVLGHRAEDFYHRLIAAKMRETRAAAEQRASSLSGQANTDVTPNQSDPIQMTIVGRVLDEMEIFNTCCRIRMLSPTKILFDMQVEEVVRGMDPREYSERQAIQRARGVVPPPPLPSGPRGAGPPPHNPVMSTWNPNAGGPVAQLGGTAPSAPVNSHSLPSSDRAPVVPSLGTLTYGTASTSAAQEYAEPFKPPTIPGIPTYNPRAGQEKLTVVVAQADNQTSNTAFNVTKKMNGLTFLCV